ncbi:hypothetical protein SAMN05443665_10032 [Actinomadura meyerae]|jgi:hypothetical protein|uniref:Uncharacterized protein n=1 Tax=Actinomadura meyerae TaxID=240840 RepID=A0A239DPF5_9ACTN|nr:hypothetical protein [Actinomadura meyerae]SNS34380.1 hypothetical protein SAMN05443665_10032 [Actinomadura meyerae]
MNELPYFAGLAMRHAWAEREVARLQADIVEARLKARARDAERAARIRRWLLGGVPERITARRRPAPPRPVRGCRRAAARSAAPRPAARTVPARSLSVPRTAGGTR